MERVPNEAIADALERLAAALEERGANPHRVGAYLRAAQTARANEASLAELYAEGGTAALRMLPGIGESLADRIAGFVECGRMELLSRLRRETPPERLLARVPGLGEELARRVHAALGIETLEELELAAHDGRLATVPGFGQRRLQGLRAQLGTMLGRASRKALRRERARAVGRTHPVPSVPMLLQIDAHYREAAAHGRLPRIAPRRFNPDGAAWLPILHTRRGPWTFSVLYSNTARAHELGKTDDWVVIHYERDGRDGQCTVVTETRGRKAGQRVVRGREDEPATLPSIVELRPALAA